MPLARRTPLAIAGSIRGLKRSLLGVAALAGALGACLHARPPTSAPASGRAAQSGAAGHAASTDSGAPAATTAAARGRIWSEVRQASLDPAAPSRFVEHDGKLFGLDRKGDLVALDPGTGAETSRLALPDRGSMSFAKLWIDAGDLIVAYDQYPQARFVRVDLGAIQVRSVVECTYDVEPLARLPGGEVATRFEGAIFRGTTVHVVFSSRRNSKSSLRSRLAVVDPTSKAPPKLLLLETPGVDDIVQVGETAYIRGSDQILAYDPTSARVRWRYQAHDFLRGLAATPDAVYVQEDTRLLALEPHNGKVRSTRAVEAQGNDGPVLTNGYVLVASKGLQRFDQKLAPAGHVALDAWLIDHGVSGRFVFGTARERLFVVDPERFELVEQFELDEDGWYTEPPWAVGDGFVGLTERSRSAERHLRWYGQVGAEALDVSGLPAGTELFEHGRRLERRPVWLGLGAHRLDLQRDGFDPATAELTVVAGETPSARTDPPRATAEPRTTLDDAFPAGVELTDVFTRSRRRVPLARSGSGGIRRGPVLISLDRDAGLERRDTGSPSSVWQVPTTAVLETLRHAVPDGDASRMRARLAAVLPDSGLAVLVSDGLTANVLGAFDLATGASRWTVPMGPSTLLLDDPDEVTEYAGQVWYIDSEVLYARSVRDGHLTRRIHVGVHDDAIANPIFDRGRVFFIYNGELQCLRLLDERIQWHIPVARDARLLRGPSPDDLLVLGARDATRVSRDGVILARRRGLTAAIHHGEPLVTPEAIYLCGGTRIYALEPRVLTTTWMHGDHSGHSPCPLAASAHQLLSTDGDAAWILDRKTGKVVQQPALGALGSVSDVSVSGGEICLFGETESECAR